MKTTTSVGKRGEALAVDFLKKKGFEVLAQNWRSGRNEIDIIVRNGPLLAFVEVKLRANTWAGEPYQFVGKQKQRSIIRAADSYIRQCVKDDPDIRFDIISIVDNPKKTSIEHLENAYYPTL